MPCKYFILYVNLEIFVAILLLSITMYLYACICIIMLGLVLKYFSLYKLIKHKQTYFKYKRITSTFINVFLFYYHIPSQRQNRSVGKALINYDVIVTIALKDNIQSLL